MRCSRPARERCRACSVINCCSPCARALMLRVRLRKSRWWRRMPETGLRAAGEPPAEVDIAAQQVRSFTSTTAASSFLPHVLVAGWLIYLAVMIWQHAAHSVQPPIYDSLSYMEKAMNFWQALGAGRLLDAFR